MNILFVTGSLFAGHDGVADYTLRLADALRQRGAGVRCLSWNETTLRAPKVKPESICLPAHLPVRAKLAHARHFLSGFTPDAVSLQFVPYAFEPRGFPLGLAQELGQLIGEAPLEVFVHELWAMPYMKVSPAYRLLGPTLQRHLVLKTLEELKPARVHTSFALYGQWLKQARLPVGPLLPLPGNVPHLPLRRPAQDPHHDRSTRHVGFFGSIFAGAPVEDFCHQLVELQETAKIKISLSSAGNLSGATLRRWQALTRRFGGVLHMERLGHLAPREASYYLQSLDFLISAYSPTFWPKSGTVAAAREFGKPVILISPPELKENPPLPEGLYTQLTPELLKNPPSYAAHAPLDELANTFLSEMRSLML